MRLHRTLAVLALGAVIATGCSSGEAARPGDDLPVEATGGWTDGEGPADADATHRSTAEAADGIGMAEEGDAMTSSAAGSGADDAGELAPLSPPVDEVAPEPEAREAGPLRAGSVDDNADFADYLAYRQQFLTTGIAVHDRDVTERHVVRVTSPDGVPVLGADVELRGADGVLARARTTADGTVRLFPLASGAGADEPLTATVTLGEARAELELARGSAAHEVTLDAPAVATPVALDVHFLLDATGSMGDELERLKDTIASVATRIGELPTDTDLHLGLTAYRDDEDAYLTKTYDFTADVADFSDALEQVVADGGGDEPEALSEGLQAALTEPAWRGGGTLKLMFLVADAPPQLDREADYAVEMVRAAEEGVMIVPLASSGTSDQGEYVFRQLALTTGGPFLFLTYGADGATPGDGTDLNVSGYDVLSLDDLVVKVVEDQLAHLAGEPVTPPQQ